MAKVDDCVVFVPYVVPGDIVDLQVTKKKHNYMEARAVRFEKYADKRCEAPCRHYGTCGGCKWQILPYEEQIKYKQKQVVDNLTRIGKIESRYRSFREISSSFFSSMAFSSHQTLPPMPFSSFIRAPMRR